MCSRGRRQVKLDDHRGLGSFLTAAGRIKAPGGEIGRLGGHPRLPATQCAAAVEEGGEQPFADPLGAVRGWPPRPR